MIPRRRCAIGERLRRPSVTSALTALGDQGEQQHAGARGIAGQSIDTTASRRVATLLLWGTCDLIGVVRPQFLGN